MTTTLTIGKRGTIVIPKTMRTQCNLDEGTKVDITMINNTILLSPSIHTRTRLDENFDQMRTLLEESGVTLESAMQTLRGIREANG